MAKKKGKSLLPAERIERSIVLIRGHKVNLDRDLAEPYGVTTSYLNRTVSRNIERFPGDFMILLTLEELQNLKCQFGTSSWGGTRKPPRAFTEHGVAMLSSVLRSSRAVKVNIEIMRAFVRLRELLSTHRDLAEKLAALEAKMDKQFAIVFEAIRALMRDPIHSPEVEGFRRPRKKK